MASKTSHRAAGNKSRNSAVQATSVFTPCKLNSGYVHVFGQSYHIVGVDKPENVVRIVEILTTEPSRGHTPVSQEVVLAQLELLVEKYDGAQWHKVLDGVRSAYGLDVADEASETEEVV